MNRKNMLPIIKIVIVILLAISFVLVSVFLIGRYAWKLSGFNACESAGIASVEVTDGEVRITGYYPGTFPKGFLGYHAEEKEGTLYVGFRFSGIFGIFEESDFDVSIPVNGEIREVVIKTADNEYSIWQPTDE